MPREMLDNATAWLINAAMQPTGAHAIDPSQLRRDPATEGALDRSGKLIVHPAEFWQTFNQTEILHFCVRHGYYCLPTTELVEWLKARIAGRKAIEIGAGHGGLAAALGIKATDNRMQEWPEIRAYYRDALQQEPVHYGENVLRQDAERAVRLHKPQVVIGAWITHKYREEDSERGGNAHGVDEERIISKVKTYIHIGHTSVHEHKTILAMPHGEFAPPWLVSRSISEGENYICQWGE